MAKLNDLRVGNLGWLRNQFGLEMLQMLGELRGMQRKQK